MPVKFGTEVP